MQKAIFEYDLIGHTGWTFEYVDSAPAWRVERMMRVRAADIFAAELGSKGN